MQYHIAIRSNPASSAALLAVETAAACLKKHQVNSIFFSEDAVKVFAESNSETIKLWQELAQKHQVPLQLCSAAMQEYELSLTDLHNASGICSLEIAGLGSHIMAAQQADKFLEL